MSRFLAATSLLCAFTFAQTSAAFAATPSATLEKALINSTLMGCLPNATGVMPFADSNAAALEAAGLDAPSSNISSALVARLAVQYNPSIAVAHDAPENIIAVASPDKHICTIGVINTPPAPLRAALKAELSHKDAPWKLETSEKKQGIAMDTYRWDIAEKPSILINISGPEEAAEGGHGLQMMVRVAQVKDKK